MPQIVQLTTKIERILNLLEVKALVTYSLNKYDTMPSLTNYSINIYNTEVNECHVYKIMETQILQEQLNLLALQIVQFYLIPQ